MTGIKKADRLQVTYFGRDKDRKFKILINDQLIKEVELDGSKGDNFYTVRLSVACNAGSSHLMEH